LEQLLYQHGLNNDLDIQQLSFELDVPSDIRFYSAHFKLDIFKFFATLPPDDYVCLVDLDVVAIREFSHSFMELIDKKIPLYYDITDQVLPAYGHQKIREDMKKLSLDIVDARWCGGEFIAGSPGFFKDITTEINTLYSHYLTHYDKLHHQGDEMITSVALELLRNKCNYYIAEAGNLGIIGRYWSNTVLHPQKPFRWFESCCLLHLPADKAFIAQWAHEKNFDGVLFLKMLKKRLKKRRLLSSIKRMIKRFRLT